MKIVVEPWWVGNKLACCNPLCRSVFQLEVGDAKNMRDATNFHSEVGLVHIISCQVCGKEIKFTEKKPEGA